MTDAQNDPGTEDLRGLMESRAGMYGFLADLYRKEVTLDKLHELQHMNFPVATGNKLVDEGYHDMYDYLRRAWDDSVTELSIDYSRAFIGHGVNGYSAAYLYESVYTSGQRLLSREARGEVLQAYRDNNLKKGKWNDVEDHISIELEFMQILSLRTRDALDKGDEDTAIEQLQRQYSFIQNHLTNWIPMMFDDLMKFSKTKFYHGLGKLTKGYCEMDQDLLQDMLEHAGVSDETLSEGEGEGSSAGEIVQKTDSGAQTS